MVTIRGQNPFGPIQDDRAAAQSQDLGGDPILGVHRGVDALEHQIDFLVQQHRADVSELEVPTALPAELRGPRLGGR